MVERNVVLDKSFGAPRTTKDGVTVAKDVELQDKFQNMGAQMVREVASETNDVSVMVLQLQLYWLKLLLEKVQNQLQLE